MRPHSGHRWLGVGRATGPDARTSGETAVREAICGRAHARLVLLFASDRLDLRALLDAAADAAGDTPLVGCSTAGEIATDGPGDGGVVAIALGGPGFQVSTAAVDDAGARLRDAGAEAAACVADVAGAPHRVLLLLTDALAGDQQAVVRGAYTVAGAGVPLVGGAAGGRSFFRPVTHQFHGRQLLQKGIVAAAIGSDAPLAVGVRHGWRRLGEPMLVTGAEGGKILTLDERPALDAYLDRLDPPPEARVDQAAFSRFALSHPLGAPRRANEEQVRLVVGADFRRRSLVSGGAISRGGLVWIMQGDVQSVLDATDAACAEALAGLGGHPPAGLVVFDCVARRSVLGESGVDEEVQRIVDRASGAPVGGFYTHGEIARTRGLAGYHNQTFVVLAVA
jgi:hypothetical protein